MPLQTQNLDVPFTGGLSTKLDQVIPDKSRLLSLSNGTFNKNGTVMRRDGWQQLSGATSISPVELCSLGGELLAIDAITNNLYSYSPAAGALVSKGKPPYFSTAITSISAPGAGTAALRSGIDSAVNGQFTCFIWSQGATNVYMTIIDEATGALIINGTQVYTGALKGAPRVCAVGSSFIVAVAPNATNNINMVAVLASTGAITTASTNVSSTFRPAGTPQGFEMIAFNGQALLVYNSSATGATVIGALCFGTTGAVTASEINVIANGVMGGSVIEGIGACSMSATTAMVMTGNTTDSKLWTATISISGSTLTVTNAATGTAIASNARQATGCLDPATGTVRVFVGNTTVIPSQTLQFSLQTMTITTANVASAVTTIANTNVLNTAAGTIMEGPFITGKAFSIGSAPGSRVYVPVQHVSQLQTTYFFLDSGGNIVGQALYGGAAYSDASTTSSLAAGALPSSPIASPGYASIPVLKAGNISYTNGVQVILQGVSRVALSYGRGANNWHATTAGSVYFSGAYMGMYDGAQCAEAGFFLFPEGVTAAASGVAGSVVAGLYQVVALWEWIDNQGRRHQSAPSVATSATMTGTQTTLTMTSPTLQLGVRAKSCTLVFYRTVANGGTFYRANAVNAALGNTLGAATMSYADTSMVSPDPIIGNEILYTTGGALPNDNPPACNAIGVFGGRIIYSNAEDPQDWRFSQYPVAGQGLYFNEALLGVRTQQNTGQISAFGVLDDKLIVATQTNKYVVTGSGPNSSGLNGTYSVPQLLPSGVGISDQRPSVVVPDVAVDDPDIPIQHAGGLMHQTLQGIYVLGRGLQDSFIGFDVEKYAKGSTVTSGVLLSDKPQIRFTVPSSSTVLVYDYLFNQWSTFACTGGISSAPASSVVWNGVWTFGDTTQLLLGTDNLGVYQDFGGLGSAAIPMSLTTAWIRLDALQGFERLRRIVFFGPAPGNTSTLAFTIAKNYDTSTAVAASLFNSSSFINGDSSRWQVRWHNPLQKGQAFQITMSDTPFGGSYAGIGFSGLTLEMGVKRGVAKNLPAGQSI
jgi:hypothetical protein